MRVWWCVAVVVCWAALASAQSTLRRNGPQIPRGMHRFETRYHVIYHDLSDDEAREVALRMTAMVEEYIQRTRDFSSNLRGSQKLPFLIFRNKEDYYAAGGMQGSAGVFTGEALMAVAGEKLNAGTWHVIQHEGFHQFADAVIGGDIPVWVNEGLAEYFGEAIYTGDGFVSGAMPAGRVRRVQAAIQGHAFLPIESMMRLSLERWNSQLDVTNYDQAWAMTQFLAHGENGRYQKAFSQFMVLINRHAPWQKAWGETFGSAEGFEEKWSAWWLAQDKQASIEFYARAATQTLTSYLARAASQKTPYKELSELTDAMQAGKVPAHRADELPATLATETLALLKDLQENGCRFSIETVPVSGSSRLTQPAVVCRVQDGPTITGTYRLQGARVRSVESRVDSPKPGK